MTNVLRTVMILLLVAGAAAARPRTASDDLQDKKRLAQIHGEFDAIKRDMTLFDGTRIPASADFAQVSAYLQQAEHALQTFEYYWKLLTDEGKGWPDAVALKTKYDVMKPYIVAARAAHTREAPIRAARAKQEWADNDAKARAEGAAQAKAENDRRNAATAGAQQTNDLCFGFWRRLPDGELRTTALALPQYAAGLKITTAEDAKLLHDNMPKVAAVCAAPEFADAPKRCVEWNHKQQNITVADVCSAAARGQDLIASGILATLQETFEFNAKQNLPTVEALKARDGWIQTTDKFVFADYMYFTEAAKKAAIKEWQKLFDAGGVPVPMNHPAWDLMQKYHDTLRASAEELAPTWPVPGKPCKGYWCPLVTKAVKSWHPNAKILKTQMDSEVRLTRDSNNRATSAYLNGWVLFQVPGEKWCQLRAWSVSEEGTGRADGVPLQFVRIQKCK